MSELDPRSPVPLYAQISAAIARQIEAGELGVGDRLPSEHALAAYFRVGRPTVRQATERLVREGQLRRERGSGTFVREPPVRVDLFSLSGTLRSFAERGVALKTTLLHRPRRVAEATGDAGPFAGREAYQLTRLGRVGRSPVLLEQFSLAPERFAGFDRIALRGRSLSQVVAEHYRLRPSGADQSIAAIAAHGAVAEALELDKGAPVLAVSRVLHFPGAPAAVHALMHCRSDRFELTHTMEGTHG
ncbi:MAG: GntR family transcriptional regulator [Myxococcales bacterium FL481]|nr:MAG: GntR family transcriptional regulator [Myxococcales bacterium FL481]